MRALWRSDRSPAHIYGHWSDVLQASPPSIRRFLSGSGVHGACAIAFCQSWSSAPLLFLGFLQHHTFIGIANAFALIGLGWAVAAHFRRYLADDLLVYAFDDYFCLRGRLHLDTFWHPMHHGMGKAQRKIQFVALGLCAVSDPYQ